MLEEQFAPVVRAYLSLPADDLAQVAETYRRIADYLHQHAENKRHTEIARLAGRSIVQRLQEMIPARMIELTESGMTYADAAQHLALTERLPLETIEQHMKLWRKRQEQTARAARDREIMRLAGRGYGNAEIARRVGVSASTVSKTIAANLKRHPPSTGR